MYCALMKRFGLGLHRILQQINRKHTVKIVYLEAQNCAIAQSLSESCRGENPRPGVQTLWVF